MGLKQEEIVFAELLVKLPREFNRVSKVVELAVCVASLDFSYDHVIALRDIGNKQGVLLMT